jgi:hypothetical protein
MANLLAAADSSTFGSSHNIDFAGWVKLEACAYHSAQALYAVTLDVTCNVTGDNIALHCVDVTKQIDKLCNVYVKNIAQFSK